jgi:hypothetical protein
MVETPVTERRRPTVDSALYDTAAVKSGSGLQSLAIRVLMVALVCAVAALLTGPSLRFSADVFEEGSIAQKKVRATSDFLVPDEPATLLKRQEAAQAVLPVYDLSPGALGAAMESFDLSFSGEAAEPATEREPPAPLAPEVMRERIDERWSLDINKQLAGALLEPAQREQLRTLIAQALEPLLTPGVVANRELFLREAKYGITVRDLEKGSSNTLEEVESTVDFDAARKELASSPPVTIDSLATLARLMAAALIRPNLVYNQGLTQELRHEASESAGPVLYQMRRGETLVREGDRVTLDQALKLKAHAIHVGVGEPRTIQYIVLFLSLFILTWICHEFGRVNVRKVALRGKDLLFIASLFVVLLALERLGIALALRLDTEVAGAMRFCVPLASGLVILRMVLNSETALVYAIPFFFAGAVGAGLESGFFFPLIASSLVGAHISGRAWRRMDFFRIGLWIGLTAALATVLVELQKGTLSDAVGWWTVLGAFLSGPLSGLLAMGLVPLAETFFGYTTDMRLTELASLDHPLLRDLMLRAPGTYHHSMVTGTLVKSAAESIGARAVLSVVAAYYHDIGKVSKPIYFIENQGGNANPHDKLAPSMSTLVLTSHVKEGVELAAKYRLGPEISDIIEQHHGTSLIHYFYKKAKETTRPDVDEVREIEYRYPGPKPQSREAALVLLADAVEAAARTLPDPHPSRIQGMVQNIINRIFADGQLDECDLSLKDLHLIARSFTRILSGIHHQRIDYPLAAHKEKRDDGDTDTKRQPQRRGQREEDNSKGEENLKRLGM